MTVIECVQSHTMGICCERVRRLAWQVDALEARLAEATERIAELEAERNRLGGVRRMHCQPNPQPAHFLRRSNPMTDDDIEGLAKAMLADYVTRHGLRNYSWESADQSEWRDTARAALAHLGERRGIFASMNDSQLRGLRSEMLNSAWPRCFLDEIDAELVRRNPTPTEPADEWREAILTILRKLLVLSSMQEAAATDILAAIAPLREKLEKDARSWKFVAECEKKANATDRRRAEAAEAKLRAIEAAMREGEL